MSDSAGDLDLVLGEIVDRRTRGETPTSAEYCERFPHLREALVRHFATLDRIGSVGRVEAETARIGSWVGPYRIVRLLGRGGMGVVYLAEPKSGGQPVALKLIAPHLAGSSRSVERFRREPAIASRLRHLNIVSVYEVGECEGELFIVMQYVEGVSLSCLLGRLREKGIESLSGLDLADLVNKTLGSPAGGESGTAGDHQGYFGAVARIVAGVADGLAYAHSCGVIHRDVKPQNILVPGDLCPRLADFGLAKDPDLASLSRSGDLLGTPHYMSPELATGGRIPVDHRTDIYSLGATLYELLTLALPYPGDSSLEVLRKVVLEGFRPPRRVNPAVPRDLEAIALKAMERDPDRRYPDAAQMAEDLRRFLRFERIRAKPPGPVRLTTRFLNRHRLGAAASAVALLGVIAAGVASHLTGRAAALRSQLAEARRFEDQKELNAALGLYERVLAEFGERTPEARGGRDRVLAAKKEALASHRRKAEEFLLRTGETDLYYALAADAFEEALRLEEDPVLRARMEDARGYFPVSITSDPAGAVVTVHPVDDATGRILEGSRIGETPVQAERLRLGTHRIIVEVPGASFGEYTVFVKRGKEARRVDAALRPTESVTANMAFVPAGKYLIGSNSSDTKGPNRPRPEQVVEVAPFFIDKTEVSNEEYARFVCATGRKPPRAWVKSGGSFSPEEGCLAVSDVTWFDALTYAEWAGKRLPTETEWEVAARGPDGWLYPWGNTFEADRARVNLTFDAGKPGLGSVNPRPERVDSRPRGMSPFGLYHMIGNVSEWVWDPYRQSDSASTDTNAVSRGRVLKGSSWKWPPSPCSSQIAGIPEARSEDWSFRCAKSARP